MKYKSPIMYFPTRLHVHQYSCRCVCELY